MIAALTRHPIKSALYSREPYVREAALDVNEVLGDNAVPTLLIHGLVLVRPDGVALGRTTAVVEFFTARGFAVADVRTVSSSPTVWRTLGIYQLTQASLDRILVNELIMTGDAIALLFCRRDGSPLPAAVEVSALKGPAQQENQSADCLRRAIGQPNRLFSLVHSADEPVDVLRELAILFQKHERREVLRAMRTPALNRSATELLERIRRDDTLPPRHFDPVRSRSLVQQAIDARLSNAVDLSPAQALLLRRGAAELNGGTGHRFAEFLGALLDAGIAVDPWDLAVAASEVITTEQPGTAKIIENFGVKAWSAPFTESARPRSRAR